MPFSPKSVFLPHSCGVSLHWCAGFTDTFRYFYPDAEGQYSWWSYRFKSRERNTGWRIDYFLCSERLNGRLRGANIHQEIFGSDHCPVELTVDI